MTRNRFIIGGPAPWPAFTAVNDSIRGGSSTSSFAVNHETNVATFAGHLGALLLARFPRAMLIG